MMCELVGRYPGFHKIEIIAELETPVRKGAALRAVRDGDEGNGARFKRFIPQSSYTPNSVLIRKLSENLMVVSFYSNAWLNYGLKYLKEVNQLQYAVGALGGQLTLVEQSEPNEGSGLNIGGYDLNLHFYFDPMDLFADRFRIYPKNFNSEDASTSEESNITRLANYIITNFYKAASSLMDIRPVQAIQHAELRYA
ncbi:hypothetical protein AAFN85_25420 [Mucilaginibacter sp. CAU 1740]|uniref:hypothetical protein n=1 Tax=Mucilaginibacter sp. CAU 1740 TaxID=3140365 RepID=UPI00325A93C1